MDERATIARRQQPSLTFQALGLLARVLPFSVTRRTQPMLYYALIFLVVGLIAGLLGLFGVAQVASQIAWILFVIGVVMLIIHLVTGRGRGARIP
jgi:uncharacterized membrane protein YtjA (UPF0391 family)